METVRVSVMGDAPREVAAGTTLGELARDYAHRRAGDILLARCGNRFFELNDPVQAGEVDFVDITDPEGRRVYARALSFVMLRAVRDVLGPEVRVVVENSLVKNYYCEIESPRLPVTPALLAQIEGRMRKLAEAKAPIRKAYFSPEEGYELLKGQGLEDKVELFRYKQTAAVKLYELDGYYNYFYSLMPPDCSYVRYFGLVPHENGFLLVLPRDNAPRAIEPPILPQKISAVFMEQVDWCRLMDVRNIAELNRTIVEDTFRDLVCVNEALHEKKFAQMADAICSRPEPVKIVLISGPSSSGKTTGANRLCVQLRVNGVEPHVISMDDYFIDRAKTPLGPDGKPDMESVYNLDLERFTHDLNALIAGEETEIPRYNFITGTREPVGKRLRLGKNSLCVIEGIHGLNPLVTRGVPVQNTFKIFISAMTQLNVDDHDNISTTDSRMIRRIVRDHQRRGYSAVETIRMWPSVTRGEADNIFPYQENADMIYNSATIYELAVLKPYVEPLLYQVGPEQPEYPTAQRLLRFLDAFLPVGSESIPTNSIIREFVGGSIFHV